MRLLERDPDVMLQARGGRACGIQLSISRSPTMRERHLREHGESDDGERGEDFGRWHSNGLRVVFRAHSPSHHSVTRSKHITWTYLIHLVYCIVHFAWIDVGASLEPLDLTSFIDSVLRRGLGILQYLSPLQ